MTHRCLISGRWGFQCLLRLASLCCYPLLQDPRYDIWRDSLLRYAGYANEVGEAFRFVQPRLVIPSCENVHPRLQAVETVAVSYWKNALKVFRHALLFSWKTEERGILHCPVERRLFALVNGRGFSALFEPC